MHPSLLVSPGLHNCLFYYHAAAFYSCLRSGTGRRRKEYGRKGRREKMNVYIQELVNLLPGLQEYERLDKAIILKNTIDFIKFHNGTLSYNHGNNIRRLLRTCNLSHYNVHAVVSPFVRINKHDYMA